MEWRGQKSIETSDIHFKVRILEKRTDGLLLTNHNRKDEQKPQLLYLKCRKCKEIDIPKMVAVEVIITDDAKDLGCRYGYRNCIKKFSERD